MTTYDGVGATQSGPLPAGYNYLRYRADIGAEGVFAAAADAVLTWRMYRWAGVAMRVSAPRAAPSVLAATMLGVGRLCVSAPREVV
jgi:uncharacterized protein (UPF0548 family)